MRSMRRLEGLSGADYEIAAIRSMIRHYWAAILEARPCLAKAEHDLLLDLCQSIQDSRLQ